MEPSPQPSPAPAPAQATPEPSGAPSFSVPESYRDRPWVEKIKSPDDLWKTLDNAQQLIGKRPASIPAADAPDEEWQKFYNAMGRPEKADAYQLKDIDGLPENYDVAAYRPKATALFHEAGLSPKQAEKLWQGFLKMDADSLKEMQGQSAEKQKQLDAEFDAALKEHFGDQQEAASKRSQEMIQRMVPEKLRGAFAELENQPKAMAAMIALTEAAHNEIEKIKKEYGAEGKLPSGDAASSQGIEDARRELAKLRTSPEARDFTNAKHKDTMKRIDELAARVDSFFRK